MISATYILFAAFLLLLICHICTVAAFARERKALLDRIMAGERGYIMLKTKKQGEKKTRRRLRAEKWRSVQKE